MCRIVKKWTFTFFSLEKEKKNFEFKSFSKSLIFKHTFIALPNQMNTQVWYVDLTVSVY